ncbi:MAG: hypothetical protein WD078_06940 [Woeseia sp.]
MIVNLMALWLPILLSAAVVFIVSSLIWTVIQWHNSDWQKLPDEDGARHALKGVPPGQYTLPHAADNKARQSSEWQQKYKEGPAAMLVVLPHGSLAMGKQLVQWFVYCLVISLLVAYVASVTLPAGTSYLKVFQVTATVGILAYAGNASMGAIWFGHTWGRTAKDIADGVIYGLLTAGLFGWLWP